MSYEQKYLKYKQKYQELKRLLGGNVDELETNNQVTEMPEFNLSDTPTGTVMESKKQIGGNETEVMEFDLTETPTGMFEQAGGSVLAPAPFMPSAPLASCAGQVNPMPNVNVPMAMQNKNIIHATEETSEAASEIQNTDDIARLFGQYGGTRRASSRSSRSSKSSKSSSDSSSSNSSTDSDISSSEW